MSAALPTDIRDRIRQKIWAKADELDWPRISDLERTAWYENWTKDKDVGGVLSHFMDARKVRVYIKVTCPDSSDHELLERSGFVVLA